MVDFADMYVYVLYMYNIETVMHEHTFLLLVPNHMFCT